MPVHAHKVGQMDVVDSGRKPDESFVGIGFVGSASAAMQMICVAL